MLLGSGYYKARILMVRDVCLFFGICVYGLLNVRRRSVDILTFRS